MTIEALLGDILAEIRGMRDTMDRQAQAAPIDTVAEVLAPIQELTAALMTPAPTEVFGKNPVPTPAGQPVTAATIPAPPAAEVAAVPAGQPAAAPAAAESRSSVELDKHGLPWDGRIHASSKAKIADGSWRQKRGVDPELVKTVEDELRKTMAAPAAPGEAWVPPAASPLSDTPWPIPEPSPAITYGEFAQTLMAGVAAGQVTILQVDAACQKHGVASFPALGNRPDLIPVIMQDLQL